MADVLAEIYNSCDPQQPATPEQYVDTKLARGEGAFVEHFLQQLRLASRSRPVHSLVSGHIGCGKSSELQHLEHLLRSGGKGQCCFPVYIDAEEFLDRFDVSPSDIILAIVASVADELRERHGIDLQDSFIVKRLNDLRKTFVTDIELDKIEIGGSQLKAAWKLLKVNQPAREQIREQLRPQLSSLLAELNTFLESARRKVRAIGPSEGTQYSDLVLILDSLEKIERIADKEEGSESQRELYIERSAQLTGIGAHMVLTVPLSLCRAAGSLLGQIYGRAPYVLPMVKVEERGSHKPYSVGRNSLVEILGRRVTLMPLDQTVEPDAMDWMLTYSGGSIRLFLQLVQQSATYVDGPPITLHAVQQALAPLVNTFSTMVPNSYWLKLVALERSADQHIDNSDPDFQAMLEQLIVMEYVNGLADGDTFSDAAPWYAVNPVIRQLRQFTNALARESRG